MSRVLRIAGRGIPLHGHDIDTDRIIPARFLKAITFEGLGEQVFADDRKTARHPFDDPRFQGAAVLVVNRNFGCGSSREHAPQALMRWGIRAMVGESFAEIFFGNCLALGIPAVAAPGPAVEQLMTSLEEHPGQEVVVDVLSRTVTYAGGTIPVSLPESAWKSLTQGLWDATGQLVAAADQVRALAAKLPYTGNFAK